MASDDIGLLANERLADLGCRERRLRKRRLKIHVRGGRDKHRHAHNAVVVFVTVHDGSVRRRLVLMCMTAGVRMNPGHADVAVLVMTDVGMNERRRQRPNLECESKPDGEKAPTHGRILLESLVLHGAVRTEFVREVIKTRARQGDRHRLHAGILPVPPMNSGKRGRERP